MLSLRGATHLAVMGWSEEYLLMELLEYLGTETISCARFA